MKMSKMRGQLAGKFKALRGETPAERLCELRIRTPQTVRGSA